MAGFVDVLLRGLVLVGGAVALGGVVFVLAVLRPSGAHAARALRLVAMGATLAAVGQLAMTGVALATLLQEFGGAASVPFVRTTYAMATLARVVLGVATACLAASLARAPRRRLAWQALAVAAVLLVASSAMISHAMARVDGRAWSLALDVAHQLAAAVWVGGLIHLVALLRVETGAHAIARRFSTVALASVTTLVAAGALLSVGYVGDPRALLETAYGVMVLTKIVLLGAILSLALANFRLVRRAASGSGALRLARFVEVEMGLAVTVLFAAASLTSLPPAADVREERATLADVGARFSAIPPRLASPAVGDLLRQIQPGVGTEVRLQVERDWSEFNHHWAGVFVLAMGLVAAAHRAGVRAARHWPLLLVALALFLLVRNDPEVWPLGPVGFWASLAIPEVLQHRVFMLLAMAFGVFEWAVRVGRLPSRPWAYVFPMVCAVAGGLLLTHSHAVFSLKEAFLMEVTHAPIGVLGAFAGWARWLELRLPDAAPFAGRVWPLCLVAVGVVLLVYSEG